MPVPRARRRVLVPTLTAAAVLASAGVAAAGPAQPEGQHVDALTAQATALMHGMSLEEKVGQLFVATVWGKSADEATQANIDHYGVATPAEVVQRYHVGGAIYFNNATTDNVDNPTQLAHFSNGLQRAAITAGPHVPLMISIDQEGGNVTRIEAPATEYPSNMAIGATRDPANATQLATINAHELRAMGINQDFAPVSDVNSNPLNPVIAARSFSAHPDIVSQMVSAEVKAYQGSGRPTETVSSAAKHFPGHGDAATDSHTGLPVISRSEADWRKIDLPPFQAAIASGIDVIMTAHISIPSLDPSGWPATLSKPIMTGILRNELHYDGVVVTDSLGMQGVRDMFGDAEVPVMALEAGVDQLLMPPDLKLAEDSVLKAVQSGRLTEQRIDQSVLRILKLKLKRGVLISPFVNENKVMTKVGTPEHLAAAQALTDPSVTVLKNDDGVLPLKNPGKVLVAGVGDTVNQDKTPTQLAAALTARGAQATALPTGLKPTAAKITAATEAAAASDVVVVLTNNLPVNTTQTDLVKALLATGKPVIAVASQAPYDAGYVTDAPTWVATYSWRGVSMTALAKVLTGEMSPRGKLPVDVPVGNDASNILFPFGTGLTW
ncbi:glycoside hydrolase family 3 protein [Labedaea rhizosphaerae]|uniref:glycoside hydrolase family 3 protein n=1 Tax=Labedaea rhizosphaerae TaxID=598644 RepID=UPI0010613D3F|nr:glycoside hydrolase family 3 protein [Labedaea rhizosphaerae]